MQGRRDKDQKDDKERPAPTLKRSPAEWLLDAVGLALVARNVWIAWVSLPLLPDMIPMHFNFAGRPDGWGSRNTI